MPLATGNDNLALALLKALGLEGQNVTELDLHLRAGHVVTVDVTRYVKTEELGVVVQELTQYELVPSQAMPRQKDGSGGLG